MDLPDYDWENLFSQKIEFLYNVDTKHENECLFSPEPLETYSSYNIDFRYRAVYGSKLYPYERYIPRPH